MSEPQATLGCLRPEQEARLSEWVRRGEGWPWVADVAAVLDELDRVRGILDRLAPTVSAHRDGILSHGCLCRWIGDEQVVVCGKHRG
jgi:hypothetical protein